MKPVWYGLLARFGDWYHGWRDGRAGIPDRDRGHATTPYREFLIRRAQDAFEHERLRFEAARTGPELALANASARLLVATAALETAEERRAELPTTLPSPQLNLRRAGETHTAQLIVRSRRTREHHRRVTALDAAVKSAKREVDQVTVELAGQRELVARRLLVAQTRVRRIHEHTHRRLSAYRAALVRYHDESAWVNQLMDSLAPELPGWAMFGVPAEKRDPPRSPRPPREPADFELTPPDPTGVRIRVGDKPLLFGSRENEHADVKVGGLQVAYEHAWVRRQGDRIVLEDTGKGQTFQGGQPVRRSVLADGDSFTIGDYQYVRDGDELVELWFGYCDLVVFGLSAGTDKKPRLTRMSFAHPAKSLLAIIGPSGSGKSSLFAALTGELPTRGEMYFANLRLPEQAAEIRANLGFVPQDDPLHRSLTVLQVLWYTDRLRRPKDIPASKRMERIDEVLAQLKIAPKKNEPLSKLSGGQLKRVSMAVEILTKPRLLLLDEPTSGLDSGMDQEVMTILYDLAMDDDGRTVVVATHSTEHLKRANRVLVVAPGGSPVYFGPVEDDLPGRLGVHDYAQLMLALANEARPPTALVEAYRSGPTAAQAQEKAKLLAQRAKAKLLAQRAKQARPARRRGPFAAFTRQFPVLVDRQLALLRAQWHKAWFTPLGLPAIGAALAAMIAGRHGLHDPGPGQQPTAASTLSFLITLCALAGQALSYSDLVNEYPIIRREHRTGILTGAVVLAKWLVFAVLAAVQALVVMAVFTLFRDGPAEGTTLPPNGEFFVDLALTSVCAMSFGLFVSAVSRNLTHAVALATISAVAQVALNGVTVSLDAWYWFFTYALPARWGLAAAASTVDLTAVGHRPSGDSLWQHTTGHWLWDVLMLLGLTVLATGAAVVGLWQHLSSRDNRPQPG